jgi:hypothetical protein
VRVFRRLPYAPSEHRRALTFEYEARFSASASAAFHGYAFVVEFSATGLMGSLKKCGPGGLSAERLC